MDRAETEDNNVGSVGRNINFSYVFSSYMGKSFKDAYTTYMERKKAMTNIKDAGELLPMLREARKEGKRVKIALSDTALEQLIVALHMCESAGRNPNVPKLIQELNTLRYQNMAYAFDVRGYVECIHKMIEGQSPCDFCEECALDECKLKARETGKGCAGWWLRNEQGVKQ